MQCFLNELKLQNDIKTATLKSEAKSTSVESRFILENRHEVKQNQPSALTHFIRQSFKIAYKADIHSFLPILIGTQQDQQLYSAMGVRCNSDSLFLDQYLPCPAATYLARKNIACPPLKLAEIGNLCSRSRRFTLPMLSVLITALFLQQTDYVLFTANAPVRNLLQQYKLPLIELVDADPKALHASQDNWGSYYESTPKVMALNVAKAMEIMLTYDKLSALLLAETVTINRLVNMIEESK